MRRVSAAVEQAMKRDARCLEVLGGSFERPLGDGPRREDEHRAERQPDEKRDAGGDTRLHAAEPGDGRRLRRHRGRSQSRRIEYVIATSSIVEWYGGSSGGWRTSSSCSIKAWIMRMRAPAVYRRVRSANGGGAW